MSIYDDDKERRRDWYERGMLSLEEYWRGLTIDERNALVMEGIDEGRVDISSPEYNDYYNRRMSGRPVRGDHSPEFLARFPWMADLENEDY